jgi:hypothetical protein
VPAVGSCSTTARPDETGFAVDAASGAHRFEQRCWPTASSWSPAASTATAGPETRNPTTRPRTVEAHRADDHPSQARDRDPARQWPHAGRRRGNQSATLSAEFHDAASGKWTPTGRMTDYHGPEAVLPRDGRVLVTGGGDAGGVYSPATGTWTATGPRIDSFAGGSALALLPNGQVLSVGGARLANCTPKGCGSEPIARPSCIPRSESPKATRSPPPAGRRPW